MSHSEEFRRLLTHASQRLAEEETTVTTAFEQVYTSAVDGSTRKCALLDRASYLTANTYARLVMDIVATFLVDNNEEDA